MKEFWNNDLDGDMIEWFPTLAKEFDNTFGNILVECVKDDNLDYPFGIDIEDRTYWYADEIERDLDYKLLQQHCYNKFYDVSFY